MFSCFGINSPFSNGGSKKSRQVYQEPPTITAEDTIINLRSLIEKQEKREQFLELKLTTMAREAKQKLGAGDKKGAVALLKKRKLYQAEQEKISQVKMTLETQAIHLESASSTADAFQAMSAGNKTMQKIRNDMGGVENVDDLMVDIQEEMQMAEEVNTALGQGIDPMMGAIDEDELMMELEELQQSDLNSKFDSAQLGTGNRMSYTLPQQPVSALSRKDDEDYRRLQAELAM